MNRKNQIEKRVFEGIRKTINRFQEKPFHFFTEADIHTMLANDIMFGKSENGTTKKKVLTTTEDENISISLVHQEYPTHFRYVKKKLLEGYKGDEDITRIDFKLEDGKKYGDRGNYDLSILDPLFISKMFEDNSFEKQKNKKYKLLPLKHIINKDIFFTEKHAPEELLYAIEVKFLNFFNASNSVMLEEVIKDNEKLRLTDFHSVGETRCINLIFCAAEGYDRRVKNKKEKESVSSRIEKYIRGNEVELYNKEKSRKKFKPPSEVLNIFIESYYNSEFKKQPPKFCSNYKKNIKPLEWAKDLIEGKE